MVSQVEIIEKYNVLYGHRVQENINIYICIYIYYFYVKNKLYILIIWSSLVPSRGTNLNSFFNR